MVKKLKANTEHKEEGGQLSSVIRESAEKIWLAGLGAFAKARQERGKAFEVLVREGLSLQSKTKAIAEERIGEVSGRVNEVKSQISSRATDSWDKLEQVFEDRVSRALESLGVPTRKDVRALIKRVDDLTTALAAMGGKLPAKTRAPRKAKVAKVAKAAKAAKAASATKAPRGNVEASKPKAGTVSASKATAAQTAQAGEAATEAPAKVRKPRARKAVAAAV